MVAPAGRISKIVDSMADLIANSTTFQTWTSSADAAEAKTKIDIWAAIGPTKFPMCQISLSSQFSLSKTSSGSHDHYGSTAGVTVLFFGSIPDTDPQEDFYTFCNTVGLILEDVLDLSGRPAFNAISLVTSPGPPQISDARQGEIEKYAAYSLDFVLGGYQ